MSKTNSLRSGMTVTLPDGSTGLVKRIQADDVHVAQPTYRGSRRIRTDIWHRSQVTPAVAS